MAELNLRNYDRAKIEADKVDEKIIEVLQSGKSFRVEAGAGSGKTYSLKKAIEWLQENKGLEFMKKKQHIVCITYTNVAVDVIASRLKDKSFIIPSTIHSFAWESIKQFQSTLIQKINENTSLHPSEGDLNSVKEIRYSLGHRYIENNVMYLYHNDVIILFQAFLDSAKFRKIFSDRYPLILIDEYQDSFKSITDKFIEHFISKKIGPQFGFFGDAWQTIYQINKPCGELNHEELVIIQKSSNFRSSQKIVDVLNKIRPSLPQISAIDGFDGEVTVISCNDFSGQRRQDRMFANDLPQDVLHDRLNAIKEKITTNYGDAKILMITHKILASQQGYDNLLDILGDKFKDGDDPLLVFFMNVIEPIFKSLNNSDMVLLFETLGVKRYPINSKNEKKKWNQLKQDLDSVRKKQAKDVIKLAINSKLIPMPSEIVELYSQFCKDTEISYANSTIGKYLNLDYTQFLSGINFLCPESVFATEHGVKGEEFDNVIFTICKGWNNYQFDIFTPMINGIVPKDKIDSFERNRNLFYVCCSRPRKRLIIFVTIPVEGEFKNYLASLVGVENCYNFDEYMKKAIIPDKEGV